MPDKEKHMQAAASLLRVALSRRFVRNLLRALGQPGQSWRKAWHLFRVLVERGPRGVHDLLARRAGHHWFQQHYRHWLTEHGTLTDSDRAAIARHSAAMTRRPRFSIVMPVYNTPEIWLRRAIDSVLAQLWADWELCIADDCSPAPHVRAVLQEYAARDPRIKLTLRDSNGHISAASNSALALATGDFIALLDHDDELAPHALYMVAAELDAHPDAKLIYSDEDKIDPDGVRFDPYFKSDWNPDLLYSHNMVSHLGVYDSAIFKRIGGFRLGFEGSQDYDLTLRFSREITPGQIRHIPHILYHWRAIPGSTALAAEEKTYPYDAARRAIAEHLAALGHPGARVTHAFAKALNRVIYPLPDPAPAVAILIPTRDRLDLLRTCVDSIRRHTRYPAYRIIIIDNQSEQPDTKAWLADQAAQGALSVLPYDQPYNFADMNNQAAAAVTEPVLVFLNNDTETTGADWLHELVGQALRPEIGAVGARLLFPDGSIQHAGIALHPEITAFNLFGGLGRGRHGYFAKANLLQNLSAVTAACLAIRRDTFLAVGGFDAAQLGIAYNDVDLCLKLRAAGYRNLYTPYAELVHYESASLGAPNDPVRRARFEREQAAFRDRWAAVIAHDPYFNPNLDFHAGDFVPAPQPRLTRPWQRFLA